MRKTLSATAAAIALASGVALAAGFAGAAQTVPTAPAGSGLVKVHNYCYKGYWYVHYCRRYGYDSYGNYVCVKSGHKREGYCGGGGGYSGGSGGY